MITSVKTVCNLCGLSACGMQVDVEDGRIVKIRGDDAHPESRGALCPKGHAVKEIVYAPDRLTQPLKRIGERGEGKWETISWDEALETIAARLQAVKAEYGAE